MSIILGLLLAHTQVLPEIDRRSLDLRARAEALQPRRQPEARQPNARPTPAQTATARQPDPAVRTVSRPTQSEPQRRTPVRRAANGGLDLSAITTICRAAGNQADPADFLATLSRAYALSASESASLRSNCAAYLAGRADARSGSGPAPH